MPPVKKSPHRKKAPVASRTRIPGYGVAEAVAGRGLLSWRWARQRLVWSRYYWIATARPDGRPHLMVVWGLWLNEFFCFATGGDSRKARNLADNPYCVIANDNADEAVIVEGVAALIPVRKESDFFRRFLKAYKRKYGYQLDGSEGNFYAVHPQVAFGLREKDFTTSATRWKFPAAKR